MNAVVLDNCDVGEGFIVATGAVLLAGTKVGPYEMKIIIVKAKYSGFTPNYYIFLSFYFAISKLLLNFAA